MWPDTRLTDLLGLDHPIVQAPMLGSVGPGLAAEVCRAGGLGSVPCGRMPGTAVRGLIERAQQLTDRPVNFNFFVLDANAAEAAVDPRLRARLAPFYQDAGLGAVPGVVPGAPASFGEDVVAVLEEMRPRVVSLHFGLPPAPVIARLKAAGIVLMASAPTVGDARRLEGAGIDVIIAQGWEAGGHRGSPVPTPPGDGVGTMALVPQVVDAVRVPVIAAGGICDARGIAAAMMLGAAGVQMGTAFLRCPEADTDAARRLQLARARDTDTIVTDAVSGRPARALRSSYAEAMAGLTGRLPGYGAMTALSQPLIEAAARRGDAVAHFHLYGQAAALAVERPAAALVADLAREALALLRRGGGLPPK